MIERKGDSEYLSNIEEFGLQVIHVLEDETGPSFSYSIGLFHNYQHPEIILVGLRQELAHSILYNFGSDIKEGNIYKEGKYYSDILDGYECLLVKVDQKFYDAYLGQAIDFYSSNDFPVIQCIYPTLKGAYPWEEKWPEDIKYLQPLLGEVKA